MCVYWQVLSAYNANFDILDATGSTPMHYAAMGGYALCIRFLTQRGKFYIYTHVYSQ